MKFLFGGWRGLCDSGFRMVEESCGVVWAVLIVVGCEIVVVVVRVFDRFSRDFCFLLVGLCRLFVVWRVRGLVV